jgi:hypothetical protein
MGRATSVPLRKELTARKICRDEFFKDTDYR